MATFNKHGNIEQTLWQHLTNIMATFNNHYCINKRYGNIEQTLWQHLTNIMATFNKHYGNI